MFIVINNSNILDNNIKEKMMNKSKQFGGEKEIIFINPPESSDRLTLVDECRRVVKEIRKVSFLKNPVAIIGQNIQITYKLSEMLEEDGYPLFDIQNKKLVQYA